MASGRTEDDILNESMTIKEVAARNRESEKWRARLEARRLTTLRQVKAQEAASGHGDSPRSHTGERMYQQY